MTLSPFATYTGHYPLVPVVRLTDGRRPTTHRFFDTSPISPSGKLVALTEFPTETRLPYPGEFAYVIVINLETGQEIYRTSTSAWDTQLGAQVQWGTSDAELYFNRKHQSEWQVHAVRVDPVNGTETALDGPVYMVSPDGRHLLSPCLNRIARVQPGYGMVVPPEHLRRNHGYPEDDGVYRTDTRTGRCELLLSLAEIRAALPDLLSRFPASAGGLYTFHVKWNPQGTRIMIVLRWRGHDNARAITESCLVTTDSDGRNIRLAIGFDQWRGGHHPNWCPDGDHIVMNLVPERQTRFARPRKWLEQITRRAPFPQMGLRYFSSAAPLRLVRFRHDGSQLTVLAPNLFGSGHPTMHRDNVHLLTDAYPHERVAQGDGTTPLRWIDHEQGTEQTVVRIRTQPAIIGERHALRVDPHPAWDRSNRLVTFNACPEGVRQVYLADFSALISADRPL